MTEKESFQIMHSELIGYYQLIELHLKGICAAILADEGRDWYERLGDYTRDPFGSLLKEIKDAQNHKHIDVLDQKDLATLDALRKTRNYWVHQCFGGEPPVPLIIFSSDGRLKNNMHAQKLLADLNDAKDWDEKLTGVFCSLKPAHPKMDFYYIRS